MVVADAKNQIDCRQYQPELLGNLRNQHIVHPENTATGFHAKGKRAEVPRAEEQVARVYSQLAAVVQMPVLNAVENPFALANAIRRDSMASGGEFLGHVDERGFRTSQRALGERVSGKRETFSV